MSSVDFQNYGKELDQDTLKSVGDLVKKLRDKQNDLASLQEQATALSKSIEDIQRVGIPDLMNSAGLGSVTLKTGESLTIIDKVHASIKKGNEVEAFDAMVGIEITEEGTSKEFATSIVESMWKHVYTIENPTKPQAEKLIEYGIPFSNQYKIHWATLNSWAKKVREEGKNVPEIISCYAYQEAKIKKAK